MMLMPRGEEVKPPDSGPFSVFAWLQWSIIAFSGLAKPKQAETSFATNQTFPSCHTVRTFCLVTGKTNVPGAEARAEDREAAGIAGNVAAVCCASCWRCCGCCCVSGCFTAFDDTVTSCTRMIFPVFLSTV